MAAPDPASLVAWPDDFGTRFTLFVDVEEEFDWRAPLDRASRSTTAMAALPDAHRRFADRGVGLTCLIDHPVAVDPAAVAILARIVEDGRSEIGSQLHAWVNPPFIETLSPAASYAGNLPPALEAAKLDALTDAIIAAFGRSPRVYRAGRYGIGPDSHALLAERGYRLDSSARARYDYSGDGGPDFRAVGNAAYRSVAGLLELPLTTVFTGHWRRGGHVLHTALGRVPKGRGIAARAGLLSRIALTPEDMPIAAALAAVDVAIGEGERLLTFSFHSPSLVPGHTPYVRDAADLARFHGWWDAMLGHLDRRGVHSATIADILGASRP
ncbi:WalW protein [Sphingomonas sp. Leaf17]|uniref:polysaccharide deacetylase family protein n=1 Tax=Sphingomonas sp. Leaf17 TaxID=1735683 RepID=UPI0006F1FF94|nr:polysaccharide deacetylase family protein [Sphingomonas sp. Leaf17]KQM65965.1 WalW protein [Sphingomonas sp. Leaf17]